MPTLKLHRLLIIATILVALWLRVHRLIELPPGLHYDEAANGILAGNIGWRGYRPVFITSYTGKETLFFYIAGGLMRLFGESVFGLRMASVFVGTLTVAVVYWLAAEVSRQLKLENWELKIENEWVAVIAAILAATHFPLLIFSRLGFRAVTQPLMQGLAVAALLHGVRTRRWVSFVAAGVFLGLTGYTYLAARLFPVLFGLFLLPLLWRYFGRILTTLATAAIVMLPLGSFFWRNPDAFWVRIGQVGGGGPELDDYAQSFLRSLKMYGGDGDPYWRFNIPGRSLLELGLFGFGVIGLALILWRLRRLSAAGVATSLLLLAAPFVMLLPTALALDEIVPSNLRVIGVYPFLLIVVAFGMAFVAERVPWDWVRNRALPTLLLLVMLPLVYQAYFAEWGRRADTFYDSDADLIAIADYIDGLPEALPIYLGSLHYRHPTVAFASDRYDDVKWLPQSEAVVLPTGDGVLIYPHSSPAPAWLAGQADAVFAGPDGDVLFETYALDEVVVPGVQTALAHNFSDLILLEGYSLLDVESVEPTLRLHWRVLGETAANFNPFVHVQDATGYRLVQRETFAYPPGQWAVGERVIQEVALALPDGMARGEVEIVVGLFEGNERLALVDEAGRFAGNTVRIGASLAGNGATPDVVTGEPISIEVADGVVLEGVDLVDSAETGQTIALALNWRISKQPPAGLFDILVDSAELPLASVAIPTQPTLPYYAVQRVPLVVPNELESGEFDVAIADSAQPNSSKLLTTLTVTRIERTFTPPLFDVTTNTTFGNQITLLGYTLSQSPGLPIFLSLVWQSEADLDTNYTVFVHVLNADGTCCVWQQDTVPQQGAYPTSRWVNGEVVVDAYELVIDEAVASGLSIEIGLYDAVTGRRLITQTGDDFLFLELLK